MAIRTPFVTCKDVQQFHGVHDAVLLFVAIVLHGNAHAGVAPASPLTGVDCIDSGRAYTMTRGNLL